MKLLSLQIGIAKSLPVGDPVGESRVLSAIGKTAVAGPVKVQRLGLDGDEQADLSVHGGLAKAVYAYPSEHYAYWQQQRQASGLSPDLPFGSMGENLTLAGLLETDLFVGDEWHFSDCVLRVTQPRQPCFKFNAVMGDKLAAKKMAQTGFCGVYLSVATPGRLRAGESFHLVPGSRQTSILSLFKVSMLKTRHD
ncbi:MAG: MOSC domain-containing protein [Leptothrix ochracea]|uniref:MOSC domain-containing protein n=1 Tax=Leptothrix ochracea TaxID=735331 RepID=UPI0034E1B16B